jgi:hypothetical protein
MQGEDLVGFYLPVEDGFVSMRTVVRLPMEYAMKGASDE